MEAYLRERAYGNGACQSPVTKYEAKQAFVRGHGGRTRFIRLPGLEKLYMRVVQYKVLTMEDENKPACEAIFVHVILIRQKAVCCAQ